MRDPNIFEVVIKQSAYDDRFIIGWRSRLFNARSELRINRRWVHECDYRYLVEFIEKLVGRTLFNFAELRLQDGERIVRDLLPHFEREIYFEMERMERRVRRAHIGIDPAIGNGDFTAATIRRVGDFRFVDEWAAPPIDEKARQKARQLLLRNLDAGQEKSFKKDGTFRVKSKDGKVYTISTQRSFNVTAADGTRYCGQLVDTPIEDQMLAQKLLLEHEPEKFFKNANVSQSFVPNSAFWIDEPPIYLGGSR